MSTYEQAKSIILLNDKIFRPNFYTWACNNFAIYTYFESEAMKFSAMGYARIGAKMIVENIRYRTILKEIGNGEWKINNSFTADLARLFLLLNPGYRGLFEIRTLHSNIVREI